MSIIDEAHKKYENKFPGYDVLKKDIDDLLRRLKRAGKSEAAREPVLKELRPAVYLYASRAADHGWYLREIGPGHENVHAADKKCRA